MLENIIFCRFAIVGTNLLTTTLVSLPKTFKQQTTIITTKFTLKTKMRNKSWKTTSDLRAKINSIELISAENVKCIGAVAAKTTQRTNIYDLLWRYVDRHYGYLSQMKWLLTWFFVYRFSALFVSWVMLQSFCSCRLRFLWLET